MFRMKRVLIASLVILSAAGGLAPASAQRVRYIPRVSHARPRIVITPAPLLYRRCVSWLELQYRPSGPVLYPQYSCRWLRG
jgi:hypothetical protein